MVSVYWIRHKEHTDVKTQGYIGVSNSPVKRWKDHAISQYVVGKAIRKYRDDIVYEVLFTGTSEGCYQLEHYFRPAVCTGWNLAIGGTKPPRPSAEACRKAGEARRGIPRPKEVCEKMSKALKGRVFTDEWKHKLSVSGMNKRGKKVLCVETGVEYVTMSEAQRQTGAAKCHISAVCSGKRKSAGGYTWIKV